MADPSAWPPMPPLGGREQIVADLTTAAVEGRCSSLVGMSNVGKSFALRALCQQHEPGVDPAHLFVYVDCNRMVEFTDQGFYELVLRCLRAELCPAEGGGPLAATLEQCYGDVVQPGSPFLAHLRFSEAIAAACESAGRRLVLVFDEFDEVMEGIGDRVLLNLRALHDSYPTRLNYISATRRRLGDLRASDGSGEFAELFAQSTCFLPPLGDHAAAALMGQWALQGCPRLEPADVPLMMEETGGHPGLLAAACHTLNRLREDAAAIGRPLSLAQIREQLDSDVACQAECAKFWHELDQAERQAVLEPEAAVEGAHPGAWQSPSERHLLRRGEKAAVPFCRLFATYVRRQRIARQMETRGVRVDVEAGDVWVDGRPVVPLTELEYRLLLLLYGHLDKIVDKYAVVEAVWGQDYIDEVDDARIEKLLSRLRQKLEVDPSQPRYLQTLRGRGYRLLSPHGA